MNSNRKPKSSLYALVLAGSIAALIAPPFASASVIYWDPNSGGTFGSINNTTAWTPNLNIVWTGSATGVTSRLQNYTTTLSDDCNWGGPSSGLGGGTVPVGTVNARTLSFNTITGTGIVILSGGTITLAAATSVTANSAGSHTISSTLAGAATSLTKLGIGTVLLSGANNYTGSTIVSAGTLTLGNSLALGNSVLDTASSIAGTASSGLKTTVTSLTLGGLSGNKDIASLFTTTSGGYNTVTALTLNTRTGLTSTYSAAIADGATGMAFLKTGLGTQVLAGANTFTGTTTVSTGTLTLDYATADNSKLADGASLVLGTGTINLTGGTHTEVVGSTTLLGTSSVTRTSGAARLALNAISGPGSIDFGADNIATTTNANDASGILGGYATIGGANWAANDGSGNIVTYAGYTNVDARGPGTIADGAATNVRILANGTSGNLELGAATTTINTLLQSNANFAATINSAGKTLATATIMIASGAESLNIGAAAGDGNLRATVAGGTLVLNIFNVAKVLTINASIGDNTTASGLTKGGAGALVLAGANTYTGATVVGSGALTLSGSLTDSAISVNSDAVFSESSTGSIGGAATITLLSSATSTLAGANTYSGFTAIANGVLNIQSGGALGSTAAGTSVTSGAALQIQGDISVGDEALTLNGNGISNTGALRNISGNNTYGGLVTLGSAARINSDAGTLTLGNPGAITGATFGLTIGGAGNTIINSVIGTTSGSLIKEGTGTLTLTGASTYTNSTSITGGILNIQHSNALGTSAGGVSVVNGAALQMQGDITVGNEALALAGTGIGGTGALRNISGNNTWGGAITLGAATRINSDAGSLILDVPSGNGFGINLNAPQNITFGGSGNITVADPIVTGTGALSKDGNGTLTLSGTNSYSGTTTVSVGTLVAASAAALGGTTADTSVTSGATLDIRANIGVEAIRVSGTGVGGNGALVASTGTGTTAGAITLMADTSIGGDGTLNVNGAVSGAVNQNNLTKVGTGTTNFGVGGSLADIGNLTANAGTTNINSAVGSGTSAVSVGPTTAATLKFGSVSQTLSSLTIGNGSTVTLTSGLAALADEAAFAEQGGVLTVSAVAVPEPGLISLLLAGALGLAARRRA